MDYIPDIDELIIAPPYRLGTNDTDYRFEAHHFILDVDGQMPDVLQSVVDQRLNAVFDPPVAGGSRRRAQTRATGQLVNLRYEVEGYVRPLLSFLRYWRVDAQNAQQLGALAYTEVILSFPVVRYRDDVPSIGEALEFIGLVYIDDSDFHAPDRDPLSIPIVFGRELFGMPKSPGEIAYVPNKIDYKQPKLQIWDYDPTRVMLELEDAIVFDPDNWVAPSRRLMANLRRRRTLPAPRSSPQLDWRAFTARRWGFANGASAFRQATPEEERVFRDWWQQTNGPRVAVGPQPRLLVVDIGTRSVLFQDDLYLHSKLVGLKQFADPVGDPANALGPTQACYQAIVETPLEEDFQDQPTTLPVGMAATIEFPPLDRVDMIAAFALKPMAAQPRRVQVQPVDMAYRFGHLTFANPSRTTVWDVP